MSVGIDEKGEMYVEGNLTISTNSVGLMFSNTTSDNSLDGTIDEFKIWNRALSASEINQLYRLTKKGVE